jgi:hypothetical protein
LLLTAAAAAADPPTYSFGTYRPMPAAEARERLAKAGIADVTWAEDRQAADQVLDALLATRPTVAAALTAARDASAAAPTALPAELSDPAVDRFARSNLAAAFTVALGGRRVYEEALTAAALVVPEDLADPAPYFFYKAAAEHALGRREPATATLGTLLERTTDVPDRYRVVATLLLFDAENWPKDEKALANLARLAANSVRRLDLARGGPQTQEIQRKIVFRLDEQIKQAEQQLKKQQQQQQAQGGQGGKGRPQECPDGSGGKKQQQASGQSQPADDSRRLQTPGKGLVDEKKLRQYEAEWGKLPDAERKRVVQEISRDLPPRYKAMVEQYFASLNRLHGYKP